jgi:predicted ATPase/DNA-binding NarL/FixJ family response regulator
MPYVDARPSAPERPHQASSLVGRDRELNRLTRLLRQPDTRLVTLTGPGGVGKTRLALTLSGTIASEFAQGMIFLDLASLGNPAALPQRLAQALSLPIIGGRAPMEAISTYLHDKHLLLLFDNFEHLLPAAPNLITLLDQCPDLKLIVTSRERLRLGPERAYPVSPLAFPIPADSLTDDEPSAGSLLSYPAIELFSNRAQSAWPDFAITPENAPVIVRICARLDGLPLALELAAARIGHISVEAMLARLDRNFAILSQGSRDAPERQQTIDATISWSYKLLDEEEQRILRALSIFEGSFTLEAMMFVTGPAADSDTERRDDLLFDALTSLVEKNLVVLLRAPGGGGDRYRLLATIREYARQQLMEVDELEAIESRHANYFMQMAEHAERLRFDQTISGDIPTLTHDRDNLRKATSYFTSHQHPEQALRIFGALWQWLFEWGSLTGAQERVLAALSLPGASSFPREYAKATGLLGALAQATGRHTEAIGYSNHSLQIARELGDKRIEGTALNTLGLVAMVRGDYQTAIYDLKAALELFEASNDLRAIWCLRHLGSVSHRLGEMEHAAEWAREGIRVAEQAGRESETAGLHHTLGLAEFGLGEYQRAENHWRKSLAIFRAHNDTWGIANALASLGAASYEQGDLERADELQSESAELYRAVGDPEGIAFRQTALGWIARAQGNQSIAREQMEAAVDLARRHEHSQSLIVALIGLAVNDLERGNRVASARHFREAAMPARAIGDTLAIITMAEWIAHAGTMVNEIPRSLLLLKLAQRWRDLSQTPLAPSERVSHAEYVATIGSGIRADAYVDPTVIGEALLLLIERESDLMLTSLEQATTPIVTLPLPAAPMPGQQRAYKLSPQEMKVLNLLVLGSTDREIAEALFISRSTASTHVAAILAKLAVPTRSAAVAIALSEGIVTSADIRRSNEIS